MSHRITASELARRLGDILGRVRYRGEVFVVERHHMPIAQVGPVPHGPSVSLREAIAAWMSAPEADPAFADDLERVSRADRPPRNPWDS
jgi:antitoxin (DNA-binding transcriptional repressor) of toxin-antitoxin stability system